MKEFGKSFKNGIISGFPIIIGYFPVAMAFGLLSRDIGISLRDSCFFSIFVFAGASQFMALDLIKTGAASVNIILATFLLNLRHLMMSASLSVKLRETKKKWLPFIAFGMTDETFSISSLNGGKLNAPFLLALHSAAYASWVCGTLTGYLAGAVLPAVVQNSLGIGLYALFAALLMPEIKKSTNILYLSLMSGTVYVMLTRFKIVPAGWSLITTIIAAAGLGLLFLKDDTEVAQE